jgi:hypothetical protein
MSEVKELEESRERTRAIGRQVIEEDREALEILAEHDRTPAKATYAPSDELTSKEAAAYVGTTYAYWRQLLIKYDVPHRKTIHGNVFQRLTLDAFVEIWEHDRSHVRYSSEEERMAALRASWREASRRYAAKRKEAEKRIDDWLAKETKKVKPRTATRT